MSSPSSSFSINPSIANLGLTMDSLSATAPPAGTARVTTGNDADDVGPAIISYTGFGDNEAGNLRLEPDTFDDPSFGATRRNMVGCNVEAVFSGGLRGSGKIVETSTGVTQANLKQKNP